MCREGWCNQRWRSLPNVLVGRMESGQTHCRRKTRERRSQVPGPMGFAPESAGNPLMCRNPGANGDSCWGSSKTKPLQLPASGSTSTSPKVLPGGAECPTGAARLHPGDSHPCLGKWEMGLFLINTCETLWGEL